MIDNGLLIKSHPGTLTDDELRFARGLATGRLSSHAPTLAGWLANVVDFEVMRRESLAVESLEPVEPRLPRLDPTRWSDGELAAAVSASFVAFCVAADAGHGNLAKMLRSVHFVVTISVESRFSKR